jgi:hypothetical protein
MEIDDIAYLSDLVVKVGEKIAGDRFRPKKYFSVNSMKKIALTPLHKFGTRYITVCWQQMVTLLRASGFNAHQADDPKLWLFRTFNLERVKVPDLAAAEGHEVRDMTHMLTGVFRTDMYGVDFIFERPARPEGIPLAIFANKLRQPRPLRRPRLCHEPLTVYGVSTRMSRTQLSPSTPGVLKRMASSMMS